MQGLSQLPHVRNAHVGQFHEVFLRLNVDVRSADVTDCHRRVTLGGGSEKYVLRSPTGVTCRTCNRGR